MKTTLIKTKNYLFTFIKIHYKELICILVLVFLLAISLAMLASMHGDLLNYVISIVCSIIASAIFALLFELFETKNKTNIIIENVKLLMLYLANIRELEIDTIKMIDSIGKLNVITNRALLFSNYTYINHYSQKIFDLICEIHKHDEILSKDMSEVINEIYSNLLSNIQFINSIINNIGTEYNYDLIMCNDITKEINLLNKLLSDKKSIFY